MCIVCGTSYEQFAIRKHLHAKLATKKIFVVRHGRNEMNAILFSFVLIMTPGDWHYFVLTSNRNGRFNRSPFIADLPMFCRGWNLVKARFAEVGDSQQEVKGSASGG